MEYVKSEIEMAVRGILSASVSEVDARRSLLIMHGQHLPRGVSFLGSLSVVFGSTGRRAHFSLARGGDDLMPMEISVEVME